MCVTMMKMERALTYLVGIDEAGRGPLAGPVAVGAVIIKESDCLALFSSLPGIRDSKQLSEKRREELYERMVFLRKENKMSFSVGLVSHTVIDTEGIVSAVRMGISSVLRKIEVDPHVCRVLLDGSLHAPKMFKNQETIVRGDETEPIISLASIAAKVVRDRKMKELATLYPLYGFEVHKGYGTKGHYAALTAYGISPIHRSSYLKSLLIC
ncbi:MAG: ribonuclease HII [Parcubacteria group bacterium Gr01-1014_48]|nr:MAG: ribonuclease HII [Parcubacteria group bacterium Gr01-1014_48]TSD08035.1 MAG: ribonuclease HII [Parcubacteria group bacterium Greene0714_4]